MSMKIAKKLIKEYNDIKNGVGCFAPRSTVHVGDWVYVHGLGLITPKSKPKKRKI